MASLATSLRSHTDQKQALTLSEWARGLFGIGATAGNKSNASYQADSKSVKNIEEELEFAPWKNLQRHF